VVGPVELKISDRGRLLVWFAFYMLPQTHRPGMNIKKGGVSLERMGKGGTANLHP